MSDVWIIAAGLAALSIASGMLGLGVAFAAVPFLGFFLHDLVHEVQPLSLLLNGITALFSLLGFARSGLVAWKPAILLAIVTTVTAPVGAWFAQHVGARWLWSFYFAAVVFLAWRMFLPDASDATRTREPNLTLALVLAAPISVVAGMLGVGPGFLLLPTLILVGFEPKHAAAVNGLAVTPPSFSALVPHVATANRPGTGSDTGRRRRSGVVLRRAHHQPVRAGQAPEAGLRRADRRDDGVQAVPASAALTGSIAMGRDQPEFGPGNRCCEVAA